MTCGVQVNQRKKGHLVQNVANKRMAAMSKPELRAGWESLSRQAGMLVGMCAHKGCVRACVYEEV